MSKQKERCPYCGQSWCGITGMTEGRKRCNSCRKVWASVPSTARDGVSCTALVGACDAEALAKRFHEAYERLAPQFGYETREDSAVPWEEVPEKNKALMRAVCAELLAPTVSSSAATPGERSTDVR
jgi:hypothetical protein